MILASAPEPGLSLTLIEFGLAAIAIASAFCWPRLASIYFSHIERGLGHLARKHGLAVAVVGSSALLLRLAILSLCPKPLPFVHDDFSFLLMSDTFAQGRLSNPTPAMWVHFESFHITMIPTYTSMYFPLQGLVLAAGKVLLGHPWFGVLCLTALMCAAICWMLQAWLPPSWALLGGLLAVLRLGLFSYWINTYTGGGSIAALGGALMLGSLPRLTKTAQHRYALLMATGLILVLGTRPYEGFLLSLPIAAVLAHWLFRGKNRPAPKTLLRLSAMPLVLLLAAASWMAYYDNRAFGNPLTLPYSINRATYAIAPYFVWQQERPEPAFHHEVFRDFYGHVELRSYVAIHNLPGFISETLMKLVKGVMFYAGVALIPPLIMLPQVLKDRRTRFLLLCVLLLMAGIAIEIFLIPHYLAPFTAAFYALGLQGMRHMRLWCPGGRPVGRSLVRLTVTLCLVLVGLRLFAAPLNLKTAEWPTGAWAGQWYGPEHFGVERAQVEKTLEELPGKQLAIVRYSASHNSLDEWVYNAANIDNSKVIWAREMDAANNLELIEYYKGRKVWLVQPDSEPLRVVPYASSMQALVEAR